MPDPNIVTWNFLDPAVRTLWRIEALIAGLVFAVMFVGAGFIVEEVLDEERLVFVVHPVLIGAALAVAVLAWSLYVASRKYAFWRYEVGDDDLSVAHGIWWRTRTYVPRARIQHVDLTAGPIARALGLAVVSVFVSGHAGAVATIPGLRADEAERLRKVLLKLSETAPPVLSETSNG